MERMTIIYTEETVYGPVVKHQYIEQAQDEDLVHCLFRYKIDINSISLIFEGHCKVRI